MVNAGERSSSLTTLTCFVGFASLVDFTLHEYKITWITQRQIFILVPDIPALTFHEWKEKYRKLGVVADAQIWLPRPPRVCILNYEWLD